MSDPEQASRQYIQNLQGEVDGAALYHALASQEENAALAKLYQQLAATEERHAAYWATKLRELGVTANPTAMRPGWRTHLLIWVAHRLGTATVLPTITSLERTDAARYAAQPAARAAGLPGDEEAHARVFSTLAAQQTGGVQGSTIAQFEGRHRATGGNALRAAVLGANDGLVSNLSLVMGVAGASLAGRSILVTGLAGLLAGSLSMAMGEWLSVQSARELYAHQIGIERGELEASPQEEAAELALIYEAKGLPADQAEQLAARIASDQATALDTLAREELGINPKELGGSPWTAAIMSFSLFAIGAIFPVGPFFFGGGIFFVAISVAVSFIALFAIGAMITVITGRNAWISGARQVLFGLIAAGITFGVGRLLGTVVGG